MNDYQLNSDFGARYYDSDISMWLSVYTERGLALSVLACRSVDPMSDFHPDYSPYAYVYNNPLNFIDPFGLDTVSANTNPKQWDIDYEEDVVDFGNNYYHHVLPEVEIKEKAPKQRHGLDIWSAGGGRDIYDMPGISDGTYNMAGSTISFWDPLSPLSNALGIKSLLDMFGIGKKNKPPIPDKDGYTTGDYEGVAHILKRDKFDFPTKNGKKRANKGDTIWKKENEFRINKNGETNKYEK